MSSRVYPCCRLLEFSFFLKIFCSIPRFLYLSVDGHLLAIVNNADMNIGVQICLLDSVGFPFFFFFGHTMQLVDSLVP